MKPLKALITCFPGGKTLYERYSNRRRRRRLDRLGDSEARFTHFYHTYKWGKSESHSGPGSTVEYTSSIRQELPKLFDRFGIERILDAPCGDYHWFRLVPRDPRIHYIGGEIVRPLVRKNQQAYGNENTEFIHLDIVKDRLPPADLWLCRDCLFHLSNEDIFSVLQNFLSSDIRYLLTSTHSECKENTDIMTGEFRFLNLALPPFSFCSPLVYIDDWIEGFPVRLLALWESQELGKAFATNPVFTYQPLDNA